jgi:hypothetical protein
LGSADCHEEPEFGELSVAVGAGLDGVARTSEATCRSKSFGWHSRVFYVGIDAAMRYGTRAIPDADFSDWLSLGLLPITLQFDQSLDVPLINEDLRAAFDLRTAPLGAALDRESGTVALAADSTFQGVGGGVNPLAELAVSVVISGTLNPVP